MAVWCYFEMIKFATVPDFIAINHTVDYMARGFMIFMRGIDITQGIGRVLLKVSPVLGLEIALATLLRFQGPK